MIGSFSCVVFYNVWIEYRFELLLISLIMCWFGCVSVMLIVVGIL